MTAQPLEAAVEQSRPRLWAICYRMTGRRSDADDLCQEAIVRALERRAQLTHDDPTGWLIRIATTTCLDHLRRTTTRRRITQLADSLDVPGIAPGTPAEDPERRAILREDVRYAVIVALQRIAPRQRAALILHDVCDRPLAEIGEMLGLNVNATKALVHRAREALRVARHRDDVDVPVDRGVVEALASAIERGSLLAIETLLADDVWGVVDGGGIIPVVSKPSFGRAAVLRRFANAWRRLDRAALAAELCSLSGEAAVIVRLACDARTVVAVIHVETRDHRIAALRIDRDPRRTSAFASR